VLLLEVLEDAVRAVFAAEVHRLFLTDRRVSGSRSS
jgi:hypothetical protein